MLISHYLSVLKDFLVKVRSGIDSGKDMSAFHKYTRGTGGGLAAKIPERKFSFCMYIIEPAQFTQ